MGAFSTFSVCLVQCTFDDFLFESCRYVSLSLQFFTKRLRAAAMLAVFAVSAVVHEYALAVCLNFFYPVLFVLFMFFGSEYLGIS